MSVVKEWPMCEIEILNEVPSCKKINPENMTEK